MRRIRIILLVTDAPAVAELVTRVLTSALSDTVVLEASNGSEAITCARAQPLELVVLDVDMGGIASGRDICLKLRALYPALPILPLSASLDAASLLADLGCAPLLYKPQLAAEPSALSGHVDTALRQKVLLEVPVGTFNYLLGQAEAALLEEQRRARFAVLVACRHPLLRSGLVHTLTSLGVFANTVTTDSDITLLPSGAQPRSQLVTGPLSDLGAIQAIGRQHRLPILLIALHQRELEALAYAQLAGASVLLFDKTGDILQFLTALQTTSAGQPFLAVAPGVIAQWVKPFDELTEREWEVIVALLFLPDYEAVAQVYGLSVQSVETYIKRVRRKLGSRTMAEVLALVQKHVTARLGVAPIGMRTQFEPARVAR